MTKICEPGSLPDAMKAVICGLGAKRAAELVNKSPSLVNRWKDADYPGSPSLADALDLEAAYVRHTGNFGPLLWLHQRRLESEIKPHQRMHPDVRMFELVTELGDVTAALRDAMDPHGPGGRNFTLEERARIVKEATEVRAVLDLFIKDHEQ